MRVLTAPRARKTIASITAVALATTGAVSAPTAAAAPLPIVAPPAVSAEQTNQMVALAAGVVGVAAVIAIIAAATAGGGKPQRGNSRTEISKRPSTDKSRTGKSASTTTTVTNRSSSKNPDSDSSGSDGNGGRAFTELNNEAVMAATKTIITAINQARKVHGFDPMVMDPALETQSLKDARELRVLASEKGSSALQNYKPNPANWINSEAMQARPWYKKGRHNYGTSVWTSRRSDAPERVVSVLLGGTDEMKMKSPILNPDFVHVGIGVSKDTTSGEWFFVINYVGRPK